MYWRGWHSPLYAMRERRGVRAEGLEKERGESKKPLGDYDRTGLLVRHTTAHTNAFILQTQEELLSTLRALQRQKATLGKTAFIEEQKVCGWSDPTYNVMLHEIFGPMMDATSQTCYGRHCR